MSHIGLNFYVKGETGILRKKFSNLQREIEKGQEEAKSAELENGKLQAIIRSLEKDIVGLKHEIMERDETIQEKEKRTYDLKKKNQGNYIGHKTSMKLEKAVGKIAKLESSF